MREAIIYSDGASSGNPGPSGIGAVIILGRRKFTISEPIGISTNNVAEYTALFRALQVARENHAEAVKVFIDSELVAKQLNGYYRVKKAQLIPLFRKVNTLLAQFRSYSITHIRREINREADSLAKGAVKAAKTHPDQAGTGELS
jgi:ribonuclease HI